MKAGAVLERAVLSGEGQAGAVQAGEVLECVINVSEGSDVDLVALLARRAGSPVLDVHLDADHNRSVFTLAGAGPDVEAAARRLAREAVARVDLRSHVGAHPRLGALDVVPWVHLLSGADGRIRDGSIHVAAAARDRFVRWLAGNLGLPCFVYGPNTPGAGQDERADRARTLPELRRRAWHPLRPDAGPGQPHPTAGAACVGARPLLVAYNLWLARADVALARRIAADIRSPELRTLALGVGDQVQVSCNLIAPWTVGPGAAFDAVATRAEVRRGELVGLLPAGVLDAIPSSRWSLLGLAASCTLEARLGRTGFEEVTT